MIELQQREDMNEEYVWRVRFLMRPNVDVIEASIVAPTAQAAMQRAVRWENMDPKHPAVLTEAFVVSVVREGTVITTG